MLFYTPSRRIATAANTAAMNATAISRMKFMGISSFDGEQSPRLLILTTTPAKIEAKNRGIQIQNAHEYYVSAFCINAAIKGAEN